MRVSASSIIDRIALVLAALSFLGTILLLSYVCNKLYTHVPLSLQRNLVIDKVLQFMFLSVMCSNLGNLIPKRLSSFRAFALKSTPIVSISIGIALSVIAVYRSDHVFSNFALSIAYLLIFAILFIIPLLAILLPAKLSDFLKNKSSIQA